MNGAFNIGSQHAGRNINNISGDMNVNNVEGNLNITHNSPPEDVLKVIQAIQQKVGELDIGDKKSIEENIKSANGILKEIKVRDVEVNCVNKKINLPYA